MKSLLLVCLLPLTVFGAKLDGLEHDHHHDDHDHQHDFPLATGREAKEATARLLEFFDAVYNDAQAYHVCREDPEHRIATFLCPNATIFHQEIFACDWWFNVDCTVSPNFYYLNEDLYKDPEEEELLGDRFVRDLESKEHKQQEGRSRRTASLGKDLDGYLPPEDGYLPPKQGYLPPDDEYLPPKNDYLPPKKEYLPPN